MFKKFIVVLAVLATVAVAAYAGTVYDRVQFKTTAATAYSWTNTYNYAGIMLKQISLINGAVAVDTVTVRRVTIDTYPQTNTVCVITNAAYTGDAKWTLDARYLKPGDILTFTSAQATGYTANIEFEVQKH